MPPGINLSVGDLSPAGQAVQDGAGGKIDWDTGKKRMIICDRRKCIGMFSYGQRVLFTWVYIFIMLLLCKNINILAYTVLSSTEAK